MGKYITKILEMIPYGIFLRCYPLLLKSKFVDFANYALYNSFLKKSRIIKSGDKYIKKVKKKGKYCFIEKGIWNYQLVNFCFVKNMLSIIIWCVECGYIPIVDLYPTNEKSYTQNTNLWEMYFLQPLFDNEVQQMKKQRVCPIVSSSISPTFNDARDSKKVTLWNTIMELFVKYNKSVLDYFDSEYKECIEGKSVVACVMRSTDYTKLKPSGHPIQPEINSVFKKIREIMRKYNVDYIYLATEDKNISEAFQNEFPNRVIENKRRYFNEQYEHEDYYQISQVHFNRENDDYLKILEYLSSINLVSKCDYLVTGLCGGSEMAIYRNGNHYKHSYVFDEGVY